VNNGIAIEVGQVKIGERNERNLPIKFGGFKAFRVELDEKKKPILNTEIMELLQDGADEIPTIIKVVLAGETPEDVMYIYRAIYAGRFPTCKQTSENKADRVGNGGVVTEVECPCEDRACRTHCILDMRLAVRPRIGTVWKFRTKGGYMIEGFKATLKTLFKKTGNLDGIPVTLEHLWRFVKGVDDEGNPRTNKIPVVAMYYEGTTAELHGFKSASRGIPWSASALFGIGEEDSPEMQQWRKDCYAAGAKLRSEHDEQMLAVIAGKVEDNIKGEGEDVDLKNPLEEEPDPKPEEAQEQKDAEDAAEEPDHKVSNLTEEQEKNVVWAEIEKLLKEVPAKDQKDVFQEATKSKNFKGWFNRKSARNAMSLGEMKTTRKKINIYNDKQIPF